MMAPAQPWDAIVDALRNELAEYGGLCGLCDEQQNKILARDADGVSALASLMEAQAGTARERRTARESAVRQFAASRGRPAGSTLRQLLPDFPEHVRPLLDALIHEVNHLVHRARQRTRQNQMMLARLVELHQLLVPSLQPQAFTKTYSRRGQLAVAGTGGTPSYRATG